MDPLNLLGRLGEVLDEVDDDDLPSRRSPRAVSPYHSTLPGPFNEDPKDHRSFPRQHVPWNQTLHELQHFVMELSRSTEGWVAEQQHRHSGNGLHRAHPATGTEPPHKRARTQRPDLMAHTSLWQRGAYDCPPRFPKLSKDDADFYRHVHYVLDDIEQRLPPTVLMPDEIDARSKVRPEEEEEVDDEKDWSRHSAQSENDHPNLRMDRRMAGAGAPFLLSQSSLGSRRQSRTSMKPFSQAFASSVAPALAECLVTLLIHLPVATVEAPDGPFATRSSSVDYAYMQTKAAAMKTLQLSVSLLRRVGALWLRIFLHQHEGHLSANASSAAPLISPTQWCLLAERIGEVLAPDGSSSPHGSAAAAPPPMSCLATWLRIVLSTWKAVVVPEIPLTEQGATTPVRHPEIPAIRSVQWWLWLLERVLPAAESSYTDADWAEVVQRIVDSVHVEDRVPPETARTVCPYSHIISENTEVAVAFQSLTARALGAVATLAASAASHGFCEAVALSLGSLVDTYALRSVAHALQVHGDASTFLLQVEEERRVEEARIVASKIKKTCAYFFSRNGSSKHDHMPRRDDDGGYDGMDADSTFRQNLDDQAPPSWPSNYLHLVAFVADSLDSAFRTSLSAGAIVQALGEQRGVEHDTKSHERRVRESYLPLWKAAAFLAAGTPMSDTHGRLVTDLAREALSSLSTAELISNLSAIESLNLTVLRACQFNPRWLFDSKVLSIGGVEDDGASSTSAEAALESLSSASAEVRHAMLLAALQLSDVDRARPPTSDASSGQSRTAKSHSREAQERLWGLVLRGRDGKHEANADVWTDYYFQQAQERGLLEGFQL